MEQPNRRGNETKQKAEKGTNNDVRDIDNCETEGGGISGKVEIHRCEGLARDIPIHVVTLRTRLRLRLRSVIENPEIIVAGTSLVSTTTASGARFRDNLAGGIGPATEIS